MNKQADRTLILHSSFISYTLSHKIDEDGWRLVIHSFVLRIHTFVQHFTWALCLDNAAIIINNSEVLMSKSWFIWWKNVKSSRLGVYNCNPSCYKLCLYIYSLCWEKCLTSVLSFDYIISLSHWSISSHCLNLQIVYFIIPWYNSFSATQTIPSKHMFESAWISWFQSSTLSSQCSQLKILKHLNSPGLVD